MAFLFRRDPLGISRRVSAVYLALCWLIGILLGICFTIPSAHLFSSLARGAAYGAVSAVGLFSVSFLPFLISAFAVYISSPRLLLPVAFIKGLLFSIASCIVLLGAGSSGWLMQILLMFGDLTGLPILFWFWQHHISGERPFSWTVTAFTGTVFLLLGSVDLRCVSPFLAMLINS